MTPIFITKEEQKIDSEQLKQSALEAEEDRLRKINNPIIIIERMAKLKQAKNNP